MDEPHTNNREEQEKRKPSAKAGHDALSESNGWMKGMGLSRRKR
jgi:hypothetical protein